MENTLRKMELLSPAGSISALRAAVTAGCDAIYIGGSRFGARAYADNPGEDALVEGIRYAHRHGVRVYLTVNTLVKETERAQVVPYLCPYYEAGLDAVIVQDPGVLRDITEAFPDLPIHISTQMSIWHGKAAGLFPKQVTRIVPARELSISELAAFTQETGLETEVFVHGALCYSFSGQCLMSSMIGGRSGNRGRCAQPCRKLYRCESSDRKDETKQYVLNLRDQCLLKKLPELFEAGVASLKIEGRMKSAEYTAVVTSVYRKWLDRLYCLGPDGYREYLKEHGEELSDDLRNMSEVFSRGDFSEGYLSGRKGPEMLLPDMPGHVGTLLGKGTVKGNTVLPHFTVLPEGGDLVLLRARDRSGLLLPVGELTMPKDMAGYRPKPVPVRWKPSDGPFPKEVLFFRVRKAGLMKELSESFLERTKTVKAEAFFRAEAGKRAELALQSRVYGKKIRVTVFGCLTEKASGAPVTKEQLRKNLRKTGGTEMEFSDISIELSGDCFLPVSAVNAIRRQGIDALLSAMEESLVREPSGLFPKPVKVPERREPSVIYTVLRPGQAAEVIRESRKRSGRSFLFFDMEGEPAECFRVLTESGSGLSGGILLPRLTNGERFPKVLRGLKALTERFPVQAVMVRSLDQLAMVRELSGNFTVMTDFTVPFMNERTAEVLSDLGVSAMSLSPELKREEITDGMRGCGILTVYGRTPVMTSEQCVRKNTGVCDHTETCMLLKDTENMAFPVRNVCRYCYNVIYNGPVLSLLGNLPAGWDFPTIRYDFTLENEEETREVLRGRIPAGTAFTKGHFLRGVE